MSEFGAAISSFDSVMGDSFEEVVLNQRSEVLYLPEGQVGSLRAEAPQQVEQHSVDLVSEPLGSQHKHLAVHLSHRVRCQWWHFIFPFHLVFMGGPVVSVFRGGVFFIVCGEAHRISCLVWYLVFDSYWHKGRINILFQYYNRRV